MTKIKFKRDDERYMILAEDHAEGSVQTCAGISAIMYSLAGWLNNNDQFLKENLQKMEPGYAFFIFSPSKHGRKQVQAVYEMVLIGLLQIEKGYADYIDIIIE